HVWLDGPWENAAWKGTKMGEILVPENSIQEETKFTIDVAKFVEDLDQKNAIYLVVEGNSSEDLFELSGLGFSSRDKKIQRPIVPKVNIDVNGTALTLADTPVRSTNANGLIGYDQYETVFKLAPGETSVPVITASSTSSEVKVTVTQAKSLSENASVKFDFKGIVKTYNIVFLLN